MGCFQGCDAVDIYADFARQNDLASELEEQYKGELATELGLTREQLSEISLEGSQNNWPLPQL